MAKKNEYMTREMVERDYLSKEKLVVITGMALLFGVFIISGIMISITLVNIGEDCDSDAYICPPELDSFLDTLLFFFSNHYNRTFCYRHCINLTNLALT